MRTARVVCLWAAALVLGGCSPSGQPVPLELQGSWLTTSPEQIDMKSMNLTLGPCTSERDCGRLEIVWDVGEPCAYYLAYDSDSNEGVNLRTTAGDSFACGWSPWSDNVVRVMPAADGTIMVVARGVSTTGTTLAQVWPQPGNP